MHINSARRFLFVTSEYKVSAPKSHSLLFAFCFIVLLQAHVHIVQPSAVLSFLD